MKKSIRTAVVICVLLAMFTGITASAISECNTPLAIPLEKYDVQAVRPGNHVVELEALALDVVNPNLIINSRLGSVTRATSRIEWNISPETIGKADTAYSLETDALVTINCTYSPRTADLDFGLITPDGTFRFTNGRDGSIQATIRVNKTGSYYFAVRNNTNEAVEVLGYVYY